MKVKVLTITQSNKTSAQNIRAELLLDALKSSKQINVVYLPIIFESKNIKGTLNRYVNKLKLGIALLKNLISLKNDEIVYFYGDFPTFAFKISSILAKKVILERTEYPNEILEAGYEFQTKALQKIKNIDGFVTCSKTLGDFYKNYFTTDRVIFDFYPVNISSFDCKRDASLRDNYIAYAGYMGGNKDGLKDLIISFSKIKNKNINLKLAGSAPQDEIDVLHKLTQNFGVTNRVIFMGNLTRDVIPDFFKKAKICVLQRPDNIQAKGGMPSKLLEYVASGTPTIVTKVGEIDNYFEDGVDCVVVEPNDPDAFTEAIDYTLDNYECALEIANKGMLKVKGNDHHLQGKRLVSFLKTVNEG